MKMNPFTTLVIEAWIPTITPSLIQHNLELQGIQVNETGMTVTIDRGHYDSTGANYAVVGVRTKSPIAFNLNYNYNDHPSTQSSTNSFYCSFFSRKASNSMDSSALYPHWLGNCYVHLDADLDNHVSTYSHRHESGHIKTWRRAVTADKAEAEAEADDAVSVEPTPVKFQMKGKPALHAKDNLRIIRLQKNNFLLRTEFEAMKSEFEAMNCGSMKKRCAPSAPTNACRTGPTSNWWSGFGYWKRNTHTCGPNI